MSLAKIYYKPSHFVPTEHLVFLTGEDNYTTIHFSDGSQATFGRPISYFDKRYPCLLRISRDRLINPASITDWARTGCLTMWIRVSDQTFWVARRRIKPLTTTLSQLYGHNHYD
jgi:DNA-binding LytR/AlgR family response regulator